MTDRHDLFDHAIFVDRIRPGKWRARIYRNRFDRHGMIDGCVHVADVDGLTKWGTRSAARRLARNLRSRGARWPKPAD